MNRSVGLVLAWVAGTVASIVVAYAAVGSVRDNVSDAPASVVVAATTVTSTSAGPTSTEADTATPPIEAIPETTEQPSTTEITTAPTTTTGPTTTTTTAANVPTTTAAPEVGDIRTFSGQGGSMSVEIVGDQLVLLGAVPSAGYTIEEQKIEPDKITIKFESSNHSTKLVAELEEDNEFEWKVDEDDEDDD